MRYLICLVFIISVSAYGKTNLTRNPIYHSITILNKKLDKKLAYEYSNIISKYSKRYKINPFLVVAISRQESHIRLNTTREKSISGIVYEEDKKRFIKVIEITDFCMMQIHKSNVISKKLDHTRLLKDSDYCIHEGIKVLVGFKRLKDKDKFWWTRYNAYSDDRREAYKWDVTKHYRKLENKIPEIDKIIDKYENSQLLATKVDKEVKNGNVTHP